MTPQLSWIFLHSSKNAEQTVFGRIRRRGRSLCAHGNSWLTACFPATSPSDVSFHSELLTGEHHSYEVILPARYQPCCHTSTVRCSLQTESESWFARLTNLCLLQFWYGMNLCLSVHSGPICVQDCVHMHVFLKIKVFVSAHSSSVEARHTD